ncbi:amidohydrolase family protein [Kribbella deserti]|uniref:Amidohydrolase family protein n=1 Tax=Kribbella deserti TaxID=1926257 RepID=A0ABV6QHU7_9ACTN
MTNVTFASVRIFNGREVVHGTHLRVADGRIDAIGNAEIVRPGEQLVDGSGATLLPGLIDAHVHLLPGSAQLAATFGVTTIIDQFSKPEVFVPELAAGSSGGAASVAAESGTAPATACSKAASVRTSGIGATAPGGHPSIAYAPFPTVSGPGDASAFVAARADQGSTHLKLIYDDGSGATLNMPSLDIATMEALIRAAHRHGLPVVAHVSTARGAVVVAQCGADVLAHVPFDRMTDGEIGSVARSGVAVISTLGLIDGFPVDGVMPLLAQPELASRLSFRWRRVLTAQANRWMPPEPPDGAAARYNATALHESGVRVLAGTDAPNPGLVHGASLHRELQHLVRAGLRPAEALTAATVTPADVFGLHDRGRLEVGARADLVLVDGDPTAAIDATQALRGTWIGGQQVDTASYAGSETELAGIRWLRATTDKIIAAIRDQWPGFPAPEEVTRDDGELLGYAVPLAGGWQATTVFGAALGPVTSREDAIELLRTEGLASLAELWWVRAIDHPDWRQARLTEVQPDRLRLHWADPMIEQPSGGTWYDVSDLEVKR